MDEENPRAQRHLFIAGTGRAGTSFLVRYLAELGLDTHLGRFGEHSAWDENANAGLENAPCPSLDGNLPYIVKSPWLYQFIDNLLANDRLSADAVVIPVRDLAEAAISRSVIERRAIYQNAAWVCDTDHVWEEWGQAPGGITYSLNPIDQGRLLAVGFHHLIQRLIAADIPIIFLAFPRLTWDAPYVFEKLRPILPQAIDHETACAAHRRVADPTKVRITREIQTSASDGRPRSAKVMRYVPADSLDAIAARREIGRLQKQLCEMREAVAAVNEAGLRDRIASLETRLAEAAGEKAQALDEMNRQYHEQINCLLLELSRLRQQTEAGISDRHALEGVVAAMRQSRSWRMMRPYRMVGERLRQVLDRQPRVEGP